MVNPAVAVVLAAEAAVGDLADACRAHDSRTATELIAAFTGQHSYRRGIFFLACSLAKVITVDAGLTGKLRQPGVPAVTLRPGDLPDSVQLFGRNGHMQGRALAWQFMENYLNDRDDRTLNKIQRGSLDPTALIRGLCELAAACPARPEVP